MARLNGHCNDCAMRILTVFLALDLMVAAAACAPGGDSEASDAEGSAEVSEDCCLDGEGSGEPDGSGDADGEGSGSGEGSGETGIEPEGSGDGSGEGSGE